MTNGSHPKESDSKVASARKSEKKPDVVKDNTDTKKETLRSSSSFAQTLSIFRSLEILAFRAANSQSGTCWSTARHRTVKLHLDDQTNGYYNTAREVAMNRYELWTSRVYLI